MNQRSCGVCLRTSTVGMAVSLLYLLQKRFFQTFRATTSVAAEDTSTHVPQWMVDSSHHFIFEDDWQEQTVHDRQGGNCNAQLALIIGLFNTRICPFPFSPMYTCGGQAVPYLRLLFHFNWIAWSMQDLQPGVCC